MKLIKLKQSNGIKGFISYRPETHEGKANTENKTYLYEVRFHEPFENLTKLESFSGFSAVNLKDGKWKRFRMDRIVSMIPINEDVEAAA